MVVLTLPVEPGGANALFSPRVATTLRSRFEAVPSTDVEVRLRLILSDDGPANIGEGFEWSVTGGSKAKSASLVFDVQVCPLSRRSRVFLYYPPPTVLQPPC